MYAAILLLFLSCFVCIKATYVKTWKAGVAKGDFFYYEMYGVFTSSDPNTIIEVPAFEQNNTDWVRVDITDVSGTVVHQLYTMQFKNRTESFELNTDLDPSNAGNFNFSEMGVPICATNLDVGDPHLEQKVTKSLHTSLSDGNFHQRAAKAEHHVVILIEANFIPQVAGHIPRPPAQFDDVDTGGCRI